MMKRTLSYGLAVAMFFNIASFAFAEEAPVFDLDDSASSQSQYTEQTDGWAPVNSEDESSNSNRSSSANFEKRDSQDQVIRQNNVMPSKLDALQNEVQSLRGQVEQLTHQLQQVQNQQRPSSSDIDKHTANQQVSKNNGESPLVDSTQQSAPKIKSKPVMQTTKAADTILPKVSNHNNTMMEEAKVTDQQPNVAEEQQIYQTAYDLIKARKYNDAITALQKMLKKYPTGQFAANAHYWLGELYGLLGKNEQSATEFSQVVSHYPDSPKVADAQLKLGLIYAAQFKWSNAKTTLKQVINHYPGTTSARLAAEQLKQIKLAGH